MRSVGIDIGSFSVKICVIDSTKKGIALNRFAEHIFVSTNPFDQNIEVIDFLRQQLGTEDLTQCHFVCSVPQDQVSVHTKIFPFKDRIKIFRSLPFELEEDTPFNPEETVFDGRIVRYEGAQSEVLACACPKDSVKKYIQLMMDSGLSLQLLTPEGIAFGNLVEKWSDPIPTVSSIYDPSIPTELPVPPRQCQGILNIGHTKTLLVVVEDSKLVDIRSLAFGGENIAKSIQEKYGITYSEALKQLQGNSFILTSHDGASNDQIFYSNLISTAVRDLVQQLRLVLMEIQASNNVVIESLLMTGGVSRLQNLGAFLTQGLEIPVNRYAVVDQYPEVYFEKSPWNVAVCGVAVGLAIEGLRKPRNPSVSFLRGEFAVQSNALKTFVANWGTTLKFAAIGVLILYVYASFKESFALSMVEQADQVMKEQAATLAKLKGSKANESGIEKFISQKRKMVKELKEVETYVGMNSALEILKKINDAAPGRATLRMEVHRLAVLDSSVELEGYVSSKKDADILQQAFRNMAKDSKITERPTRFSVPAGKVGFGFNFSVDRNVKMSKAATPETKGSVKK